MPHGHHGGGGFHHGRHHHHHHHHHHRHMGESRIGFPIFGLPLLGAFWRPRYYYGPRYRGGSGCSIFALLFGILILFAFIHFWWLLIPLAVLAVLGIMSLLKSLTGKSASPGANYQPYNQPYQANQPYQQGYSMPPGPGYQPYPPQSGWGQYDMPQAQYPQNMPPMP